MDQVKNIGVILPNMEISQLSYEVLTQINIEIINNSPLDYRIFFENVGISCVKPLCGVMNIAEIWGYSGFLISTTLDNTLFSLKLTTDVERLFYIWDLEWLRSQKNYLYNLSILRNPNIKLIVRSEDASKEVDRYCNRKPDFITDRLSFSKLAEVLWQK